jgi:DNA replication and repair protein RecF
LYIKSLKINNLRNIESLSIAADPCLNLFHGDNGAGKTSILEALVVLAKGRSFRSPSIKALIGPHDNHLRVVSDCVSDEQTSHRLGLERSANSWKGRLDGEDVSRFSDLGRHLPLVVMEPDSHELISGAPERRRRYLDWGVFHVEPTYLDTWRRYDRALRQRNAALRRRHEDSLDALDPQLVQLGERLDRERHRQADSAASRIKALLPELSPELETIELSYQRGWKGDSLEEALSQSRARDMERGSTGPGPHRGDLYVSTDSGPARERLSRGECKALSAGLLMAQAQLLVEKGGGPALLLDDLASELDPEHRDRVLNMALGMGLQTWVTGTEKTILEGINPNSARVFHVEHGQALEMV